MSVPSGRIELEAVSPGGKAETAPPHSVARSVVHLFSGQVATTILSIVLNAQLGRTLGPSDFGLYFFISTSAFFTHLFVEWGQASILIRDVARTPQATPALLGSAIAIRLALSVPAAIVGAIVVRFLGYDAKTQALMGWMVLACVPNALVSVLGLVFRGHERMDLDARATVVNKAAHVALVTVAFSLGGRVASIVATVAAAGTGALAYSVRQAGRIGLGRPRVERETVRRLLSDGTPVLAMAVLSQANVYVETLTLSALAPQDVLGWYGAARTITNTLIMPAAIVISASFPSLSRAARDPDALRASLERALRPVVILGVLVAAGTAMFADVAIGLIYGKASYAPAIALLRFTAPWLFMAFLNMLLVSVAIVLAKTTRIAAYRVVVMALAAALGWKLVPVAEAEWGNGALGLLVAAALSELATLVGSTALAPKGTVGLRTLGIFLRAVVAAGGASLLTLALPIASPFVRIPAFLAVFFLGAIVMRLVRREDLAAAMEAVRRKVGF